MPAMWIWMMIIRTADCVYCRYCGIYDCV